jgi:uncharacterized Zn ribbon protein
VPREDLEEVLKNMRRVSLAQISYDKSALGSEFLQLTESLFNAKSEVEVIVKAQRSLSIKEIAMDIFRKLNTGKNKKMIRNLRIEGKSEHDSPIVINTSLVQKKESIDCEVDPVTGTIVSTDMFRKMRVFASED